MSKWKQIKKEEADRLLKDALDSGVQVKFHIPPECGGQIQESAYADIGALGILCRVTDWSDRSVTWYFREWAEADEDHLGLNFDPW